MSEMQFTAQEMRYMAFKECRAIAEEGVDLL